MVHEKNSRVSLCVQELFHPQDSLSEFLQPFRYVGIIRVSPNLFVILFLGGFLLSGWFSQQLLLRDFRRVLAFPHVHLTRLLDGDPSLPVLVYPHFRLTRLLEDDLNDQFPLKVSWVLK